MVSIISFKAPQTNAILCLNGLAKNICNPTSRTLSSLLLCRFLTVHFSKKLANIAINNMSYLTNKRRKKMPMLMAAEDAKGKRYRDCVSKHAEELPSLPCPLPDMCVQADTKHPLLPSMNKYDGVFSMLLSMRLFHCYIVFLDMCL